ncbi:MAG: septum formation protein Maf [Chlorobiota bacterium]|jgi:septum formation protein|nr:MAG: septum formation protein Maf [Chlorobiota bacterium]
MGTCAKDLVGLSAPVILASSSPRRKQLLGMLGIEATIIPASLDEERFEQMPPRRMVEELAFRKALAAQTHVPDAIIIGADTTVVLDETMLSKPHDAEHACAMLRTLSGRTHTVITGVAVLWGAFRLVDSRSTRVTFRSLSEEEIRTYVATGSPLDKAGGYGIQDDCGAVFVESIEGCYYTVVGLPVELLYRMLRLVTQCK